MTMSELQLYYDNFRAGWWASENEDECACHGKGWALSEVDTWHKCPVHFHGQPSPEDCDGFESAEEYETYRDICLVTWAVEHGLAEYTPAETSRRAAERAEALSYLPPVVATEGDDADIPF
jgi:hypothetical protein